MSTTQIGPGPEVPPLPPPSPLPPAPPMVKNPWIALVLSFLFPGVGQIYNGQIAKAIFFVGAFVGSMFVMIKEGEPLPFALFLPFIIFWNLVDAFRSASVISDRTAGRPLAEEDVAEGPGWSIALIVIGTVILLSNLGFFSLASLSRYWPLALIVAGLLFLRRSMTRRPGDGAGV